MLEASLDRSWGPRISPYLANQPRILRDACRATRHDEDGRYCAACCVRAFCEQQARRAGRLPEVAA